IIQAECSSLGTYDLYCQSAEKLLFTENESNTHRLWGVPNHTPYVKDAINDAVLLDKVALVNPNKVGTKAAAHYRLLLAPGESVSIRLRLAKIEDETRATSASKELAPLVDPLSDFDELFATRRREADEFYHRLAPTSLGDEHRAIQRQALGGMIWSKQFY